MTGATPSPLGDADLNGLADGRLGSEREAELLRRLQALPADRARVEAWREQNDLIRATFSEVVAEPVPVSLILTQPPRLRCVATDGRPMPATSIVEDEKRETKSRWAMVGLTVLVACAGLGLWIAVDRPYEPALRTFSAADRMVTPQTIAVLDLEPQTDRGLAFGTARPASRTLPTASIPDLADQGFRFTGAVVMPTDPATVLFSYGNTADERLTLSVAKDPNDRAGVDPVGSETRTVRWQHAGARFVLTGNPPTERLRALGLALQASENAEDGAN